MSTTKNLVNIYSQIEKFVLKTNISIEKLIYLLKLQHRFKLITIPSFFLKPSDGFYQQFILFYISTVKFY